MLCVIIVIHAPIKAHAGLRESWSFLVETVKAGIIGSSTDQEQPQVDEDESGDDEEPTITATEESGMCKVPQTPPEVVCELGSGFLCVNTPKRGVADSWSIISGTFDRQGSVITNVGIVSQHEYTKETVVVDTTNPETENCWDSNLESRPFCLDKDGYFAARIPLDTIGPYTVSITASRLSGATMTKAVRFSRVEAPAFTSDMVSFDPDILSEQSISEGVVSVVIELLGGCQFCDNIGASTGAVRISVENTITDAGGTTRHVACETNMEQGGQGRFAIGVPVGSGKNSLTITVCNAAVEDDCPHISGIEFTGSAGQSGMEIIEPKSLPAYDVSEYPYIDWQFRLSGTKDGGANVQLNRQGIEKVCSDDGVFRVRLDPSPGINVVTVETETDLGKKHYPWTFGWGQMSSPFDQDGKVSVDTGLIAKRAFQLALPSRSLTHVLQPILSNFLSSDGFGHFVSSILGGVPPTRDDATGTGEASDEALETQQQSIEKIKNSLEGCEAASEGFMEGKRIEIVGKPTIGKAQVEDMRFEQDAMVFTINADNVDARIRLVKDEDLDGIPEGDPLPLLISFRKVYIDIKLERATDSDGRDIILISSPHTDCDYKSDRYCKHMPAPLIPKYFLGSANRLHGFVSCDTEGQLVSDDMKGLCDSLNSLDAQTGIVSQKVLDAINGTIYCTGSSTLTHLLGGGAMTGPLRVGCFPDDPEDRRGPIMGCTSGGMGDVFGPWVLSVGMDLGDGLEITEDGIYVTAHLRVGNKDFFEKINDELKHPSIGVVVDPKSDGASPPIASAKTDRLMRLAVSTNALNHILFLLTEQMVDDDPSGLLDLDLSTPFFERLGFDFVEQCDALNEGGGQVKQPSPLCNIRPRVGELLGSSLTTYKYFPQNYPLMMSIKGNRALSPHLRITSLAELPIVSRVEGEEEEEVSADPPTGSLIDLQLGGVQLAFYALEVDEEAPLDDYGNPKIVLDEDGNPIIKSMRPEDSDPRNGQIISFELTLLLALEVGDVTAYPDDPSSFMLSLRPLADRSRLVLTPVSGSNSTTVPPEGLVSALREKLSYAISIFSAREKAIKIPIPKNIVLSPDMPSPESLFGLLGLKELRLESDGLTLEWKEEGSFLTVDLSGALLQQFQNGGDIFEEKYPD